jgi:hypothetical protein
MIRSHQLEDRSRALSRPRISGSVPSGTATPVVLRGERAAQHRRHAKRVEVIAARPESLDEVGLPTPRHVEARRPEREGGLEQLVTPRADRFPQWIRPGAEARHVRHERREPVRPLDRQRAKHEAVNEGEGRRVGADAERE